MRTSAMVLISGAVVGACSPPGPPNTAKRHPRPEVLVLAEDASGGGDADGADAPLVPTPPAPCGAPPPTSTAAPAHAPLRRTITTRDRRFGSVTCLADREVWHDSDDRMRVCTVARPVTLHEITIAAGAYTHFFSNGRPDQTTLAKPQPLPTAAGETIHCAAALVSLNEDGSLELCKLSQPMTVGDVACRAGASIAFHSDGSLHGAVLDAPYATALATFPPGTRLEWRPDGTLAGGWLPEPLRVAGRSIHHAFTLHDNGYPAIVDLAEAETFGGHVIPALATVRFRSDGSLHSAEYMSRMGAMPHGELWMDTTFERFDCDGRLTHSHVEREIPPAAPRIPRGGP